MTSLPTKEIVFPKNVTLGELSVYGGPNIPPQIVPAKGTIVVPGNTLVTLNVRLASKADFRHLSYLQPDDLHQLVIENIDLNDKSLGVLRHLSGLKSLIIRNDPVCYGSFLKDFVWDVRLSELRLENDCITSANAAYLSNLQTQLTALVITHTPHVKDEILETLQYYRGEILDLSYTGLTGGAKFGRCFGANLRELSLAHTGISDVTLRSLRADLRSHLEILNLSYTPITREGVEALGTIPTLRHLDLSGARIDNASITRIGSQFPNLETVNVADTSVTDTSELKPKTTVVIRCK